MVEVFGKRALRDEVLAGQIPEVAT
jgi:hypothetical protein